MNREQYYAYKLWLDAIRDIVIGVSVFVQIGLVWWLINSE